ncbi:hypothetical protein C4D60_Mb03t09310 [Musa balbisiana]|uniref:Uncharacterized protein n=1 Tax=Musa balbisiana TaxID=52838 RepID=A0A4S8J8R9_MUSBA|nr:hypothetical protein C4D60_Mb03t09310 [Musa balbisiana]
MAYRRKQPAARISTTFEDPRSAASAAEAQASLATRAIRASAAHRDASSLSSAYGESAVSSPHNESHRMRSSPPPQRDSDSYEYVSMKNLNESKYGFWGTLARKAKSFVDNDDTNNQFQALERNPHQTFDRSTVDRFHHVDRSPEIYQKTETTHKRSDAIGSSLNHIGGTIKNAIEEGLTIVENKTANIIHETRKLSIRRKGNAATMQGQAAEKLGQEYIPQIQTDYETQLKASRDVANAMAAKAKLLLRELKTVKADLIFARERCAQLEEENKMLRESHEKGDCPEDDDLIRLQLETLLVEKARLAHENSIYARENRFLREIVEYHQLTMQDVVYVDEGVEEVTEVYTTPNASLSLSRAASEASTGFISTPLAPARTNSSPATLQPSLLPSPSIIVPEDCSIVLMQPPLSVPPKSTLPPQSAA